MSSNRSSISQENVKRFIIVLGIVLVVLAAVYFATRIFVTKDLFNKKAPEAETPVKINYDITTVGLMLSRPYKEYYVLAYYVTKDETLDPTIEAAVNAYKAQTTAKKVYYLKLAEFTNKQYYTNGKTNPQAKTIEEIKLGAMTLLKIKNQKIIAAYEGEEVVLKELK